MSSDNLEDILPIDKFYDHRYTCRPSWTVRDEKLCQIASNTTDPNIFNRIYPDKECLPMAYLENLCNRSNNIFELHIKWIYDAGKCTPDFYNGILWAGVYGKLSENRVKFIRNKCMEYIEKNQLNNSEISEFNKEIIRIDEQMHIGSYNGVYKHIIF